VISSEEHTSLVVLIVSDAKKGKLTQLCNLDGAEGEGRPLVDGGVGGEAGSGVAEERNRIEEGSAALLVRRMVRPGKQKPAVDLAERDEILAPVPKGHNLQILVISESVYPRQDFPALSNV
jgi:hypothetical protein